MGSLLKREGLSVEPAHFSLISLHFPWPDERAQYGTEAFSKAVFWSQQCYCGAENSSVTWILAKSQLVHSRLSHLNHPNLPTSAREFSDYKRKILDVCHLTVFKLQSACHRICWCSVLLSVTTLAPASLNHSEPPEMPQVCSEGLQSAPSLVNLPALPSAWFCPPRLPVKFLRRSL